MHSMSVKPEEQLATKDVFTVHNVTDMIMLHDAAVWYPGPEEKVARSVFLVSCRSAAGKHTWAMHVTLLHNVVAGLQQSSLQPPSALTRYT